jgi:hypothetical protein
VRRCLDVAGFRTLPSSSLMLDDAVLRITGDWSQTKQRGATAWRWWCKPLVNLVLTPTTSGA